MSGRLLDPGQRVVWVTETVEPPVGSRATYEDALRTEPRKWLVHVEQGTSTGIEHSETETFSATRQEESTTCGDIATS